MTFHFPRLFKKPDRHPNRHAEMVTSSAGFAVLALVIIEAAFKAATGSRPPLHESEALVAHMASSAHWILGVVITDTFLLASMTVFLAGLLFLAYKKLGRITMAMIAAAFFTVIYVTITLLGDSLDAGTAINATQSVGDATVIRTLIEALTVVFGPIGGIILAFLSAAFGIAMLQSRLLPRWIAIAAFMVTVVNFIATPALFDVYREWNAKIALLALVSCVVWVVVTSVALMVRKRT